jgi:hypothetical protein
MGGGRKERRPVICAIALAGAALAGASSGDGAPIGRCDPAQDTAAPFAPELADSGRIYRGTFSPDGRELWFFKKVGDDPRAEDYRIYLARRRGREWSAAERVLLGGEFPDLYPTLSPDGRRLVFTSYRRAPGDTTAHPSASLWMATRRGAGWSSPEPLVALARAGAYHSQPLFLPDGRLLFRRTSPDWNTTTTLVAAPRGNGFAAPETYGPVERWRPWRDDLQVWGGAPTPDGSALLLDVSSRRPGERRPQPSDLWVSLRAAEGWRTPTPLAAGVNTAAGWENFAVASPDGCRLVFVRDFSGFYEVGLRAAIGAAHRP